MKGIFKIISIVVLLGALVGGAILVQKNQETRKGAAANTPELIFQTNSNTVPVGQSFNINLAIDTKSQKMDIFEFGLEFDKTKIKINSISPIWYTEGGSNLYSEGISYFKHLPSDDVDTPPDQVMLKNIDNNNGTLKVSAVSMRPVVKTAGGVVQLFKVSVTILADGPAMIKMSSTGTNQAQLDSKMVTLDSSKSITFNNASPTSGATSTPKPTPTGVKCTPRLKCMDMTPPCNPIVLPGTIFCPKVTPTTSIATPTIKYAKEGEVCSGVSIVCEAGLKCNSGVNETTAQGICVKTKCTPRPACLDAVPACKMPELESYCPKPTPNIIKITPTGLPLSCGWCGTSCVDSKIKNVCPMIAPPLNQSCVAENGVCVIKNINPITATLNGGFTNTTVSVGSEVSSFMKVGVGDYKVSAVSVRAIFDPNYFEILSVTPIAGVEVQRNNVDKVTGVVDLYLTWNGAVSTLPISPEFVTVKLKTKKSGVGTFKFDGNYKNEVSGVDSAGKSTGFNVLISGTVPRLIVTELVKPPVCLVCVSGLAKSMGNGNCDAVVNSVDFEIWRNEMFDQSGVTGKLLPNWNADYNCDQKVSGVDFEIWRATVFK